MRADREHGIATVELAFLLPILLVLLAFVAPIVRAGWEYMALTRATAHGIRYATKVDVNARCIGTVESSGLCSGELRRRPTTAEVEEFVREAARPLDVGSVTVTPEPAGSLPGELVVVTVTHEFRFGVLADVANAVKGTFFGGQLLPQSSEIAVSAQGRQE